MDRRRKKPLGDQGDIAGDVVDPVLLKKRVDSAERSRRYRARQKELRSTSPLSTVNACEPAGSNDENQRPNNGISVVQRSTISAKKRCSPLTIGSSPTDGRVHCTPLSAVTEDATAVRSSDEQAREEMRKAKNRIRQQEYRKRKREEREKAEEGYNIQTPTLPTVENGQDQPPKKRKYVRKNKTVPGNKQDNVSTPNLHGLDPTLCSGVTEQQQTPASVNRFPVDVTPVSALTADHGQTGSKLNQSYEKDGHVVVDGWLHRNDDYLPSYSAVMRNNDGNGEQGRSRRRKKQPGLRQKRQVLHVMMRWDITEIGILMKTTISILARRILMPQTPVFSMIYPFKSKMKRQGCTVYVMLNTSRIEWTPARAETEGILMTMFMPICQKKHHVLIRAKDCIHCGAKRIRGEGVAFCCRSGMVKIHTPEVPAEFKRLFTSQTDADAKYFRKNIIYFNSHFSFTSMGAKVDRRVAAAAGTGVYTFRIQGQVYHMLDQLSHGKYGPRHMQLYFYDTDFSIEHRAKRSPHLDEGLIRKILQLLESNPYTMTFRRLGGVSNLEEYKIELNTEIDVDQRRYNAPTVSQVAAIWMPGTDPEHAFERSVMVCGLADKPVYIRAYHGCYDPLSYPLFFPGGEAGWNKNIKYVDKEKDDGGDKEENEEPADIIDPEQGQSNGDIESEQFPGDPDSKNTKFVSAREYYCYKLQIRDLEFNILFYGGRLFQQYIVDIYIKIETMRLDWFSKPAHQKVYDRERTWRRPSRHVAIMNTEYVVY
ncbi:hypothetical protein EJB05_34614 [Eragrostis curvula]|uniref:Helitron helicase-like domain-containing protein n=1 Tax=Eragrostis curvula TaxID=38414 RepID=A0A5J9U5T9_9POAL|nr:hypothetical protein EJB05_34614 [Eragrostis curvula]